MYNVAENCIFHVNTTGQSSGERIVTNADGIVDINELHECLNDVDKTVKLCLHVTNSNDTEEQYFDCTAKLRDEKDIYVFTLNTRTYTGSGIRKLIMKFNDFDEEEKIEVKYYDS